MTRCARLVLCLGGLLSAVVLGACSRGSAAHGAGTLKATGDVQVAGLSIAEGTPVTLHPGDLVTVRTGRAVVTVPGGATLEMRDGSMVRFDAQPSLIAGDLLAESGAQALHIATGVGEVTVKGVAGLQRDLALTVRTYAGDAAVAAGRTVVVPALSQETVASIGVTPQPSPLHIDSADTWDQRYLATAIELTRQIESQSSYVTANAPDGSASSVAFFTHALHPLSASAVFNQAVLQSATVNSVARPAGEQLVAAAVALAGPGDFAGRWNAVFQLRDAGAQWGIVVLDERADPMQVLRLIEDAVANGSLTPTPPPLAPADVLVAPAPKVPTLPTTPTVQAIAVPKASTSKSAPPKKTAPQATKPATGATATSPPATSPPNTLPPNNGLLAPVVNPLLQLVHNLLSPPPPTH